MLTPSNALKEKRDEFQSPFPISIHHMDYDNKEIYLFYLHWHQEFELFLVTKGIITLEIESKSYILHKGEALFINRNVLHVAKNNHQQSCAFKAIVFHDDLLINQNEKLLYNKYILPIINQKDFMCICMKDMDLNIIYLFNQVEQSYRLNEELKIKSILLNFWNTLYECIFSKQIPIFSIINNDNILDSIAFIETNYMQDIKLDHLAKLSCLSVSQFSKLFKERMHMSPIQYLMRVRIMNSCQKLLETDTKISSIALMCGFNNISYYNKIFYSFIGCTPSNYRQHRYTH